MTLPSRRLLLAAAPAAALLLAGCGDDPNSVAAQAKAGDQKGYVAGDGSIEEIPADERGAPVSLKGTTLDGASWSSADAKGKVVVLNVWGSWCAPCAVEAPDLQQVWEQVQRDKKPVQFMGINWRDNPASGRAFAKKHGLTFPSLHDDSGVLILDLQGKATGAPTTLVLDTQGRIAGVVVGVVRAGTLSALVDTALKG